jgi:hypothetical protein
LIRCGRFHSIRCAILGLIACAGFSCALFVFFLFVLIVLIRLVFFIVPFGLLRGGLVRLAVDTLDLLLFKCFFELDIFVFEFNSFGFELFYLRSGICVVVSQAHHHIDELFLCQPLKEVIFSLDNSLGYSPRQSPP